MSFLKQLAGETVIYGLGHIIPRLLQYLFFTPFFTRYLSKSDYGAHGIYYMFGGLLMIFFSFRMETAFFRFGANKENQTQSFITAFLFVSLLSISLFFILGTFSESIAQMLTMSAHRRYVWYMLGIIALDAIASIPFARLRLRQRALSYTWIKLLNVSITIILVLSLILLLPWLHKKGLDINPKWLDKSVYLDYIFASNLVASATVLMLLLVRHFDMRAMPNTALLGRMLRYAWPLIPVGIAGIINTVGDQWMVKEFLKGDALSNLEQSGIYTAAKRVAVLMSLFTTAYNYAVEPFFFRNASKNNSKWMYARTAEVFSIISCLIMLAIVFYLDVLQYLLGAQMRGGLFIIPIAVMSFYFLGMYYNFSVWYKLTDQTVYGSVISMIGAAITISLNLILLPRIGFIASSIASLICFLVMCVLCVYFGKKSYPVPYRFKKMGFYLGLTILFMALSHSAAEHFALDLTPKLILNTTLIIVFLATLFQLEKNDLLRIAKGT